MTPLQETLYRCWASGMGITQTKKALWRQHRVKVDSETVRLAFVDFAEKYGEC